MYIQSSKYHKHTIVIGMMFTNFAISFMGDPHCFNKRPLRSLHQPQPHLTIQQLGAVEQRTSRMAALLEATNHVVILWNFMGKVRCLLERSVAKYLPTWCNICDYIYMSENEAVTHQKGHFKDKHISHNYPCFLGDHIFRQTRFCHDQA